MPGLGAFELIIILLAMLAGIAWLGASVLKRRAPTPPLAARLDPAGDPDPEALEQLTVGARAVRDASGDVAAITFVRQMTGWDLVVAKNYVDELA
jgi:hypothetical protein